MKVETIKVMDVVSGTSTSVDGIPLYTVIKKHFDDSVKVRLSLEDVTPMSSSFLNATFGYLFDEYGFDKIKESVVLSNYRLPDALRIKKYLEELKSFA